MPTINEVWEQAQQINANLAVIHNDLTSLNARNDETNDWLEEIRTLLSEGFTAMAQGIAGIHSRQEMMLRVLVFQARQQQTMICALENISRNTCHIYNEAKRQTGLQTDMAADLFALHHMYATANPEAALVYRRHREDTAAREACCPPEPFKPPCEYQPCPKPEDLKREQPEKYAGYAAKPSAVVRVRLHGGPD